MSTLEFPLNEPRPEKANNVKACESNEMHLVEDIMTLILDFIYITSLSFSCVPESGHIPS